MYTITIRKVVEQCIAVHRLTTVSHADVRSSRLWCSVAAALTVWRVLKTRRYSLQHVRLDARKFHQCQWRNQEFMLGVLMFPFPPLPSPPLPLEVGPQIQLGGLGERCKLPSGVWGGAPAEVDCGAFLALKYAIWWQQF